MFLLKNFTDAITSSEHVLHKSQFKPYNVLCFTPPRQSNWVPDISPACKVEIGRMIVLNPL